MAAHRPMRVHFETCFCSKTCSWPRCGLQGRAWPAQHTCTAGRHGAGRCAASIEEQSASTPAAETSTPTAAGLPAGTGRFWLAELADGSYWHQARSSFPSVPWGPEDLVKVLVLGVVATGACAAAGTLLLPDVAADASPQQQALRHLAQEGLLAAALPSVVWAALVRQRPESAGQFFTASWDAGQVQQAAATCVLVFPLADPVLHNLWSPLVEHLVGPPPGSSLVASLQAAAAQGSWNSIGLHCLASGVLGPIWEEVFWRGFFLASLTKVLPLPACITLSSLNFAVLHLSPHNALPLLLLSSACDAMYLRWHNLLPPLLLHGLWNTSQLLAIAFLGKHDFV